MNDILTVCIRVAREAGDFLLDNFEKKILSIEKKPDKSLATNLDREAERMITDRIKGFFPGHGILGEESGLTGSSDEYLWIIDPLDGTHNYIRGIGLFGVSVGVAFHGRFVAGAVYLPVSNEFYTGEKNNGAFKNNKIIHVSDTGKLIESTIIFDSEIRNDPNLKLKILKELAGSVFNIRMLGSSVRHLSYIAEGKIDADIELHDKPWDFAGSVTIIEEAGGKINSLDGYELTYRDTGFIASNGVLQKEISEIILNSKNKFKIN